MLRKGIGIDLGTTRTTVCSAEAEVLLREPTVVAIDSAGGDVVEAGQAALALAAEYPDRVQLSYPVWDNVVKETSVLAAMLRIFMRRALGRTVLRPHVMISIPCDITEAQENAVEDAALAAGAGHVYLLEAPLCAALGAGIDFSSPMGQMLVHVGASRTEAAMIFLGDMAAHTSLPVGGIRFDAAIIRYMREKHRLYIGRRTAEQIKIRIGMVSEHREEDVKTLDVKGRCAITDHTRVITLNSREMIDALIEPIGEVMDALITAVEQTPEDLLADIRKNGVVLTGGGVLQGMDQLIADVTSIRTRLAPNSETAAAEGAALALGRLTNNQR